MSVVLDFEEKRKKMLYRILYKFLKGSNRVITPYGVAHTSPNSREKPSRQLLVSKVIYKHSTFIQKSFVCIYSYCALQSQQQYNISCTLCIYFLNFTSPITYFETLAPASLSVHRIHRRK